MNAKKNNHQGYPLTIILSFLITAIAVFAMSGGLLFTQNLAIDKPETEISNEDIDSPEIQSEFMNTIVLKETYLLDTANALGPQNENPKSEISNIASAVPEDDSAASHVAVVSNKTDYVSEQYVMTLIKKTTKKLFNQDLTSYAILSLEDYSTALDASFFWQGQCLTQQRYIIQFVVEASSGTLLYIDRSPSGTYEMDEGFMQHIQTFNISAAQNEKKVSTLQMAESLNEYLQNIESQLDYIERLGEDRDLVVYGNNIKSMRNISGDITPSNIDLYLENMGIPEVISISSEHLLNLKINGLFDTLSFEEENAEISTVRFLFLMDDNPIFAVRFPTQSEKYSSVIILYSSDYSFYGFQLTPFITGINEIDDNILWEAYFYYSFFYHDY